MYFSIGELLKETSSFKSNKKALFDDSNSLTWKEAYKISTAFSKIIEKNLKKFSFNPHGNTIAIYLDHSVLQSLALFGISLSGNIFTIIHPASSKEQLSHQLSDSGALLVLTDSKKQNELQDLNIKYEVFDYQLNSYLNLKSSNKFYKWLKSEPATLVYTSGSTGLAKGVIVPNSTLLDGVAIVNSYLKIDRNDKVLSILPFNFDYGLNQLLISAKVGAELYIYKYLLPFDLIKFISKHKISYFAVVPSIWNNLLNAAKVNKVNLKNVKKLTTAGGPHSLVLLKNIKKIFNKANIFVMYGLTESFRTSYLDPKDLLLYENSIGKPVPGVQVKILRENYTECEVDEIGTLFHIGAFINYGYLNSEKLTAQKFVFLEHPTFKSIRIPAVNSGDLVSKNKDGYLIYHGRKDSQFKISGFRISPNQIESAFSKIDHINLCAATVLTIEGNENVVLLLESNTTLTSDDLNKLRNQSKKLLPSYAVPKFIFQVKEIPKNKNFKVDYQKVSKVAEEKLNEEHNN